MIQETIFHASHLRWVLPLIMFVGALLVGSECAAQEDNALDPRQIANGLNSLETQDAEMLPLSKRELLQQFEGRSPSQEQCIAELFIAMMDMDNEGIKTGLGTFAALTTEPEHELRRTVGKLSLCVSIRESDASRAETLYKSLVKGAMREETPLASRRDMVRMVGFINGLFFLNESSPIPQEVLKRGGSLLVNEKSGGLAATYTTAREQGVERQQFVTEQMELWNGFTPEERFETLKTTRSELESIRSEYDEKLAATRDEHADQQAAFKGIFRSRKRMMAELGIVIDEQNTPTPGHPGPPPNPPRVPKRDSVRVDEYETKREKKGDKWETVRVRRDRDDIERERDRKFRDLQNQYDKDKDRYDRLDQVFRQAMAAWVVRDQARRQDLGVKRDDLETRITQLNLQQANLNNTKKIAMHELEQLDEHLNELEKLASVQQCVDEAIASNDTGLAYRASAWEAIDFALEKSQLLRCLRSGDSLP